MKSNVDLTLNRDFRKDKFSMSDVLKQTIPWKERKITYMNLHADQFDQWWVPNDPSYSITLNTNSTFDISFEEWDDSNFTGFSIEMPTTYETMLSSSTSSIQMNGNTVTFYSSPKTRKYDIFGCEQKMELIESVRFPKPKRRIFNHEVPWKRTLKSKSNVMLNYNQYGRLLTPWVTTPWEFEEDRIYRRRMDMMDYHNIPWSRKDEDDEDITTTWLREYM